ADQGVEMSEGGALDDIDIIGLTGEVCINSLRQDVSPVIYIALPEGYSSLCWAYIRLADGFDRRECVRKINEVLLEMDPSYLFDVKLYDNILGELYKPEIKQEKIVSLFSLLAAILALVGIFGQVLLDLQYSRRTIAIRKVYGADNSPLIWDCLKKYTFKLLLSFLIAVPLGWLAIVRWQEGFAEKVGISRLEFVVAFLMIAALTMAIVVVMSWRAVRANPVESLRKE
ncbi:MAG: ABC transporter permease, partial [Candidatus Cryptobacteroides sp.]